MNPRKSLARAISTMAIAAVMLAVQSTRQAATRHYFATRTTEDLYYLPPPGALRALDLGFHEAASDILWSTALVYFGTGIRDRIGARYVVEYARAMTTLDPNWTRPYVWAPTAAAYQPVQLPLRTLEQAGAFASEGCVKFPSHGELAWLAGAFWSYELAPRYPRGSAERAAAVAKGQRFLLNAARLGAGPSWLALNNASALVRLGNRELAVRHLEEMYSLTDDPDVRDEIAQRIALLRSEAHREAIERTLQEAERAWRRDAPYLTPGLYELVGPPVRGIER